MLSSVFTNKVFGSSVFSQKRNFFGVESAYAVGFDGSNDYITGGTTSSLAVVHQTAICTICAWVKLSSYTMDAVQTFIATSDAGTSGKGFAFRYNNRTSDGSPRRLELLIGKGTGGTYGLNGISNNSVISNNNWHHVAVTTNGTNVAFYVDGNSVGGTGTVAGVASGTSQYPPWIGANPFGVGEQFLNGLIDDLRIYNRALTAAEIASIYANTSSPPTSGLVAYFPMDEGTGTTTTDTVGGLVGTLTNGPTWQPQVCPRLRSGREIATNGWGVSLDGSNVITLPAATPINNVFSNSATVTLWFKADTYGEASSGRFFYKGHLGRVLTSGRLSFSIFNSLSAEFTATTNNDAFTLTTWTHVAFAYDNNGDRKPRIYCNGIEVSYATQGTVTGTVYSDELITWNIGAQDGIRQFDGNIKDVRIYNSALSAADIAKLANNVPITATPVGHWKLDEGSGTTAIDSSGNGNNGTLTNGPTYSGDIPQWFRPAIKSNYAGSFDGTNDYIEIPNTIIDGTEDYSIILFYQSLRSRQQETIFSIQDITTDHLIDLRLNHGDVGSDFITYSTYESGYGTISTQIAYPDYSWHHIGITKTGLVGKLFLDGILKIEAATKNVTNTTLVRIGCITIPGVYYPFYGKIDDLCFYQRKITDAEVADAAAGYLIRAGLVSRYKLDGDANDAHGANHGTEQGGVTYSTSTSGTI